MKLSTKLLIALAIIFFVVPTLVASYFVRMNRIDANVYRADLEKEVSNVNANDVYFKSFPVAKFDKVNILGASARGINLYVVKSDRYVVKVDKKQADFIKTKVNGEGYLTLEFLAGGDLYYKSIYIFSPNLKILKLDKVGISKFSAKLDELTIIGDSVNAFSLAGESVLNTLNLNLTNSRIDNLEYRNNDDSGSINHLALDVTNTTLGLPRTNYQRADIIAKHSNIYFIKKADNAKVNALNIQTEGVSSIRLDSLQWDTLNGSLSNDTKIDLPIGALRNLIK